MCKGCPLRNTRVQRAEQDLNAQREMAQWAEGMLWAAWAIGLLTFGATVVGVRYVYLTLVATQDMARETTRIGEAQVRAYLNIKDVLLGFNDDSKSPVIKMTIVNTGQSPAREIEMVFRFSFFPNFVNIDAPADIQDQTVRWWFDDIPGGQEFTCSPTSLSDVRMQTEVFGESMDGLSGVHFHVALYALDVFCKEITAFGHFIVKWDAGQTRQDMKAAFDMSPVMPAELIVEELRPYRRGYERHGKG
jgi:hypothetical protein